MATEVKTDAEIMADYDAEIARIRATLPPEELTEFDIERAVDRAELEQELAELDEDLDDDDDEDDEDDEDDDPAAFGAALGPVVAFCDGGCPTPGDPDDLVERGGLIFRVGRYDDVNFEMSKPALAQAVKNFRPVPIRLEHKDSILDGKLGWLRSASLSADGSEMHGKAALPRWLINLLPPGTPLKVSASWDRLTKTLRELSLVLSPRIEGAALAEFSRSTTQPSRTSTMSLSRDFETPEQYAKRTCAKYDGKNRIGGKDGRTAAAPAEFSTGTMETPTERAKRLIAKHGDGYKRSPAPAPAAPTTPAPAPFYMPPPVTPTDLEEGQFLTQLAKAKGGPEAAAEAIRSVAAALPARVGSFHHSFKETWIGMVRPHGEPLARLEAESRALEAAADNEPVRYVPPSADEAAAAQRRLIIAVAMAGRMSPANLLGQVRDVSHHLAVFEGRVDAEQARHLTDRTADVETLRDKYHRARLPLAGHDGLKTALLETQILLPRFLAEAVAEAVEAHGGRETLASDLAALRLLGAADPPGSGSEAHEAEAAELADVVAQLKSLGQTPGRLQETLQARRSELSGRIGARISKTREKARADATAELSQALEGDASAFDALVATVKARPDAFAEGLDVALSRVPAKALSEVGAFVAPPA